MRGVASSVAWLALLALGIVSAGSDADAARAKKSCTVKRVPVTYCVMRHRGRLDCTAKVWRTDRICR